MLSCQALSHTTNLFTLEELKEEFQRKVLFGFLEGIWYLDIIYQGHRPAPYIQEHEASQCDVKIELPSDLDLEQETESDRVADDNETCYRRDFFSMLEDVVLLGGGTPDLSQFLNQY